MAKTICPSFPKASVDYMTSWLIEHNCELTVERQLVDLQMGF